MVVDGRTFVRGHHVVLRPEADRNAQDHLLEGRSADHRAHLHRLRGQVHLCVTVDDDPGQDIMRDIGRYLFFKPDRGGGHRLMTPTFEKQILVAGVGNAWMQDDAFGGECARRLRGARRALRA